MTLAQPEAPVFGLLLTGGRSSRMRRDKAALEYRGRTQLEDAYELLASVTKRAFISVRPDQVNEPLRQRFPQIVDAQTELGPLAGILAAQGAHPHAIWLVLACDLPFLDGSVLRYLLERRDREGYATAFRSTHDGLPEPLCAVYEPRSVAALARYATRGKSCPRKFLIEHHATLLEPLRAEALDNVNSTADYWTSMQALSPDALPSRSVRVQYFALLREQAGRSEEALTTAARTPAELYGELQTRYGFTLPADMLKVAVNAEFGDWSQPLQNHDSIVFIPPVAGG
ncbi:MAG: molybdenum cofactor biosynthesis protein MoaAD [Gammaproteobacteria bacterium]|nr:molybdenum cofactor biosynthesis protein MoaAD [Gammaproteobacteria bacterium]